MPEYLVDEFIGHDNATHTIEEQVDKKVSLLYDLCILCKRGRYADNREEAVKKLLSSYESEVQIDNAVHNIIVGDYTLNDLLKRKGYM